MYTSIWFVAMSCRQPKQFMHRFIVDGYILAFICLLFKFSKLHTCAHDVRKRICPMNVGFTQMAFHWPILFWHWKNGAHGTYTKYKRCCTHNRLNIMFFMSVLRSIVIQFGLIHFCLIYWLSMSPPSFPSRTSSLKLEYPTEIIFFT